jgi:hypothetical protein
VSRIGSYPRRIEVRPAHHLVQPDQHVPGNDIGAGVRGIYHQVGGLVRFCSIAASSAKPAARSYRGRRRAFVSAGVSANPAAAWWLMSHLRTPDHAPATQDVYRVLSLWLRSFSRIFARCGARAKVSG